MAEVTSVCCVCVFFFFFQAEAGIRDAQESRGLGDVYKRQVLHSARQDIEVIYQTAQFMPASIFDTQIAAGLLGFAPQMGYASLIKELFDTELAKSHTRADWTRLLYSSDAPHDCTGVDLAGGRVLSKMQET